MTSVLKEEQLIALSGYLLLGAALIFGQLMQSHVAKGDSLLAAKVQCQHEFVLEDVRTREFLDLNYTVNPAVFEPGSTMMGLCVKAENLRFLRGHYIIRD